MMFLAAEDFVVNSDLILTLLGIVFLFLGCLWLWRHKG